MSSQTLIRDSAVLLLMSTAAAFILQGASWAIPFALAGVVAIANLYLITLLTRKLIVPPEQRETAGGSRMALGMLIKFTGTSIALVALIANFEVAPVLFGFGVVMLAITFRGVLGLFLPAPAQEA